MVNNLVFRWHETFDFSMVLGAYGRLIQGFFKRIHGSCAIYWATLAVMGWISWCTWRMGGSTGWIRGYGYRGVATNPFISKPNLARGLTYHGY